MASYDDWKTTPPEPEVVVPCAYCDETIVEGDDVYMTQDADVVHTDCWKDYSLKILGAYKVVVTRAEER